MTETLYKNSFPSSLENLTEVIREALSALEQAGWLESENQHCLRLCLEEGLVNAITHGNQSDAERVVDIRILAEADSLQICIRDEGGGFNPALVPEPKSDQLGGRGVCLIKHFMDGVEYDAEDNCLRMRLRRSAPASKE